MVIVLFRLCLVFLQTALFSSAGNYSALPSWQLLLLPIFAVIAIIAVAKITGFKHYRMGIPFVIHRFKIYYGHIPFATSVNQFFGGVLALASGFVVGKEGPTVHLAAAASHYVGRWFSLPFNSLRILAGCGIAAGIAAAFNTPFAAVIFVMEVVMREYKVHIFVPVMLAAACGSVVTRVVFGDYAELNFFVFQAMSYWQLPMLVLLGISLGILASLFNKHLMFTMKLFRPVGMVIRLLLAGVISGLVAYFMPHALGAEFVNVSNIIATTPVLGELLIIFIAKFFLAIVAIALGVPGGIIGAVMVIGMLAGCIFLTSLGYLVDMDDLTANYTLLGLAGFLAAVLHAPMAAITAVMELSSTQAIILPALITVVSAYVTSKQLCNNRSIFIQQLEYQDLPYTTTAIRDVLQDTGVMALMRCDLHIMDNANDADLYAYLQDHPEQLLVAKQHNTDGAIWQLVSLDISLQENAYPITLHNMTLLSQQNTLAEVYELLYKQRQGAVAITSTQHQGVCGLITWNMLHTYLLRQQH
ncbi:MAG: chloride channel protein [Glaciecola sp.]